MIAFSKRLGDLVDDLDSGGMGCFGIEEEHDKEPLRLIGRDGYSTPAPDFSCSYKATLMHMRELADSANRAAENLPDPRRRFALPFAAMGLLHLKAWHGHKVGAIDVFSRAVEQLQAICIDAGITLSNEALRNALSVEFNQFDPYYFPPGIWEIISGE